MFEKFWPQCRLEAVYATEFSTKTALDKFDRQTVGKHPTRGDRRVLGVFVVRVHSPRIESDQLLLWTSDFWMLGFRPWAFRP